MRNITQETGDESLGNAVVQIIKPFSNKKKEKKSKDALKKNDVAFRAEKQILLIFSP